MKWTELNIPVSKLKISDAISLYAEAWKATKTEILYCLLLLLHLASPLSKEQNDDNENLNEIEEVQKLLDQYNNFNFGDLMNAEEFILIDDDNNYEEKEITDEEIVNIVKSNEMDLAEEEIILQSKMSVSEALASLDKVLSFLDNPPDNFIIELNNRNLSHDLKKHIVLFDKNSRVQSVLDGWLSI
ncbi:hypothetical protein RirG_120570 [Rhizophagus irregularis DAOM 197198w]|uniref:Uncharacterized protein n=1 Tax=Rhizophagus irregularis (strain DAOM 197198w) TaxID=1432141 RepID=A0A015L2Z0_RHIIW|nr:hypothetical protein RirG_120570 [Rhizophagus irregularis DAOM 197198w]